MFFISNLIFFSLLTSGYSIQRKDGNAPKLFLCSFCSYSTYKSSNIKSHVRVHTQERPFVCKICHKGFNHKVSLDSHMHWHTGLKPFVCANCHRQFSNKTSLKRHVLIHCSPQLSSLSNIQG